MDSNKLVDAIESAGFSARSYSGRGMYGSRCVGIEVDKYTSSFGVAAEIISELLDVDCSEDGLDFVRELARIDVQEDSLGLGGIVYFPRVEWPVGRKDTEDDGEYQEDIDE